MTSITFAHLCSSATYRDGLYSILEAGLEVFTARSVPLVIAPTLLVRFDGDPIDIGRQQAFSISVVSADSIELLSVNQTFELPTPDPSVPALTHFYVHRQGLPIHLTAVGEYRVVVSLNGVVERTLPFLLQLAKG